MRDISRPLLLVALGVLFVVLTSVGPGFFFGFHFGGTLRWVLFGLLIYFIFARGGGCCGSGTRCCCCWGDCTCDDEEEEDEA